MDVERKRKIDKLLANLFFGCNISFNIVESEHFKAFISALNNQYKPPTRETLSTTILDAQYNEFVNSIRKDEPQDGVVIIDGWKNSVVNNKTVVAMLHLTSGQNLFLDTWNFSTIRETGEALSKVINDCSQIASKKYNIRIYAVVTDNASNMNSMEKQTNLWHLTCNSHSGNLLCKSLTDNLFDEKVNDVIKDFRSSNLENQLISRGGKKMVLPTDTCWYSKRNAYRRCLENINIMRDIVRNNEHQHLENQYIFKDDVVNTLFEETLEQKLTDTVIMYDPVCSLINTCQKINCNIADATEKWFQLSVTACSEEFEIILQQHLTKVITPYGLAANFLHPVYKGRRFINNEHYVNMMNEFFKNSLSQNGLQQIEVFKNETHIFGVMFEKQFKSAGTFWKAAKPFYSELSSLAEKLLNIPASTAEIKKLFSQWIQVHCKKDHRSTKLAALYYSLKLEDSTLLNLSDNED